MLNPASLYRSPQGYQSAMSAYDAQLRRWPVPFREQCVATRYGDTHMIVSGPEDAPPLFLIHGLAVNALVWRPNVAAFSQHYRVYAVDNIGDLGKSAPSRPPLHNDAYGQWMVDVFDALGIERVRIIGMSLGGWITLKTAIYAPERVDRLVVLCPAGFVALQLGFLVRAAAASFLPSPQTIDAFGRSLVAPTSQMSPEDRELFELMIRHHRVKLGPIILLTPDDLARVTAPTLLLTGRYDTLYDAQAMVERAKRRIANVQAEIIEGAGHGINADQPGIFHQRALDFLGVD
jgi:pimeloyl-ACP methyl ester carboxylesterase